MKKECDTWSVDESDYRTLNPSSAFPGLRNQGAEIANGKMEVEDQRHGLRVVGDGKECEVEHWQYGHRAAAKDCRTRTHDRE